MSIVQLAEVSVAFGTRYVLKNASMTLHDGEAAGLIGVNGSGKTTLLRLIAGSAQPDSGRVERRRQLRVAFLEQEPALPAEANVHDAALSAFSDLVEMERRMRDIEHEIAVAEETRRGALLAQLGQLQTHFEHAGGYERENRTATVLHGLGFAQEEFGKPVSVLSGGERTRLALARLLLRDADLLLLDEPTNHLDLSGIEWLESFLQKRFKGAVLVVSHDRVFLDRVVRKIVELEEGGLKEYPGNYTQFATIKGANRADQLRQYEAQQEFIAKEEDFIRRYHYGQRAREARGRQTRLDRLERIDAPPPQKRIRIRFTPKKESGDICMRAEDLTKGFGDRVLFRNVTFDVTRGDRLGIVGPNGSGKTTLLRMLLGEEPPDRGIAAPGRNVEIAYLAQQIGGLSGDRTVLDEVWDRHRTLDEVEVRSVLGRFLFSSDEAIQKRMANLSGGERTRVALALMMLDRPNVLVLDEPTNHLDIPSREALESALDDYDGAIVTVSHDRYFINRIVKRLLVLDGEGAARIVHGNYEDYERQRQSAPPPPAPEAASAQRAASPRDKAKEKPRFSKNRLAKLEADIARLEGEKAALEAELSRPELYADAVKAREVPHRYEAVSKELDALYLEWTEQEGV